MHVASLQLCKDLYKLTGWKETDNFYQFIEYSDLSTGYYLHNPAIATPLNAHAVPAYDLGYLLRRLPQNTWVGYVDTSGKRGYAYAYIYAWNDAGNDTQKIAECQGDTPEDALCKLAIDVFRFERKLFTQPKEDTSHA